MPPRLRLLCIGGHPADTFDGCGGTLAHHVQDGDEVTVVALTAGTRIHDVVISDAMRARDRIPDAAELQALMAERAQVKEDEVRRACAFLGITDVRFFGYDDAVLTLREELILRMAALIREVRPDVIITHHPNELGEYGNHHAMTAQLVLNGIGAAHGVGMGDPNPPHRVAQVFFTTHALVMPSNVMSGPLHWYPDLIVDITDVVEDKVRALDAMRSQQYGGELRAEDDRDGRRVDGLGRRRGLRRGVHDLPAEREPDVPGVGLAAPAGVGVGSRPDVPADPDHRDDGGPPRLRAARAYARRVSSSRMVSSAIRSPSPGRM